MIKNMILENVGPVGKDGRLTFDFTKRVNLFTGDNGLGKTFILDAVWRSMTKTWAQEPFAKNIDTKLKPEILFETDLRPEKLGVIYDKTSESWFGPPDSYPASYTFSPVIYLKYDGMLSIWDPYKSARWEEDTRIIEENVNVNFTKDEIWNGKFKNEDKSKSILCRGLIEDWNTWRDRKEENFKILKEILNILSPEGEKIEPIISARASLHDAREIPRIKLPYGNIFITQASSGFQQIFALAYMLVWAWSEHKYYSKEFDRFPSDHVIVLIDEVESHLHPSWQRKFLPSLFEAMKYLYKEKTEVQLIATTHSPLVLASLEQIFDNAVDQILTLDINKKASENNNERNKKTVKPVVEVNKFHWSKPGQGDISNWLISDVFGLNQARSPEAERVINAADAFMLDELDNLPNDLDTQDKIHQKLLQVLPEHDRYWARWVGSYSEISE
ncbi:AAA family ATPase [Calditrichota bacterium]